MDEQEQEAELTDVQKAGRAIRHLRFYSRVAVRKLRIRMDCGYMDRQQFERARAIVEGQYRQKMDEHFQTLVESEIAYGAPRHLMTD